MRPSQQLVLLSFNILWLGCGHPPGGGFSDGSSSASAIAVPSVTQLLQDPPPDDTLIVLRGVVIVGRSANSTDGRVYVQDASGGVQSLIRAQCNYGGTTPNCIGSKPLMLKYSRGDVVNVTGSVLHHTPGSAPPDVTTLVIDNAHFEVTSSGATPAFTPVMAASVAKDQVASRYRNTYVIVTDGPFQMTNTMPYEFHNGCSGTTLTNYKGFEVANSSSTLAAELSLHDMLTACLPDACSTIPCTNVVQGGYGAIGGIAEPDYGGLPKQAFLKIMPTSDSDLAR
jgi:hypothetical protein